MKNKRVLVIVLTILVIYLLVPIPRGFVRDGGTKLIGPMSGVYEIIEYHSLMKLGDGELKAHSDPDYKPPTTRTVKKGTEIKIFGRTVYDGSYVVVEHIN